MPPEIDFTLYMVICAFCGPAERTNGGLVQEVLRRGDALVIRYDWVTFQTASGFDGRAPAPAPSGTPYGIWVVERFDGQVILEEDKQGLLNQPPLWREVHRF
jgi:hypothetical protein